MSESDRTPAAEPDVCIVGSGPAGSLIAYKLAEHGHDVVVLEAGETFEFATRTERMERALRPTHHRTTVWDLDQARDAYTVSGPVSYPANRLRAKGVGGSTLHWGGRVARFTEKDFEMQTRYGYGRDWPVDYEDIRPYYAAAEAAFGVAGAEDNPFGPPREQEYPMDAFPRSHSDSLFAEACSTLDIEVHSVPNARNSESYDGRSQCVGYGTCSPVCPSGAKYDASVHAKKAIEQGATLIDRAVVQRLEHDASGDRITGAVYETPDGTTYTQSADEFVLAAGGIENPRLLLLSESPQHPEGLANSSGAVGKYLMEHPYVGVAGRLDRKTAQNRIGFGTMESYQFYEPGTVGPGSFKIEFSNQGGPKPVELALKQREPLVNLQKTAQNIGIDPLVELGKDTEPIVWGDELRDLIADATGDRFTVVAEIEVLPNERNQVTLDTSETDAFGNPVPNIEWGHFTDYAEETMDAAKDILGNIVDELPGTVRDREVFELRQGAGHSAGTTRMGTDPSASVVDENLRAHDVENLSIAGSSPFVTMGASQPTLTIGATSLRLAEYLHDSVL
ncbi:GMC family oxidoreductase [Halomicroarcula sp. F28]|uniref:GMC family oxidoreductase n=1 Tax=Haloarcula salinisoli TaxID=2487746 RepID=UPI001C72EB30|nr:GMC family oxidoreductase [Halomicroarcula salinisoli]MBX0286461.1 GMC family oxidoreductase [Halomicroarcula salinisoli]